MVNRIVESQLVERKNTLEKVLAGHEIDGETKAQKIESFLNPTLVVTRRTQVESLNPDLGLSPNPLNE